MPDGSQLTRSQIENIQWWLGVAQGGVNSALLTGVWDAATIAAVQWWQQTRGIPVTGQWDANTQASVEQAVAALAPITPGPEQVRNIQRVMRNAVGYKGPVDGYWNSDLTWSVRVWQNRNGIAETGQWNEATQAVTANMLAYVTKVAESRNGTALGELAVVLDRYDLGDLVEWAWQRILAGESQAEILNKLRATDQFNNRFKAINMRRDAGLSPISPEEVIQYEEQASALMRAAGMPRNFYNEPDDFARLIGNNLSIVELGTRVNDMFVAISRAPVEIRNTFTEYFGAHGDAALAALFLDPERAAPDLINMVRTANFAGTVRQFGFNPDFATAKRGGEMGISIEEARRGAQELEELQPLFAETISETMDLIAEREGFNLVFGIEGPGGPLARPNVAMQQSGTPTVTDINAQETVGGPLAIPGDKAVGEPAAATGGEQVRRRRRERQAEMSGGGGPTVGQGGVRGLS